MSTRNRRPATGPAPTREQAAEARREAAAVKPEDRAMVDALLAERLGYVQRNLSDRVAQVDEQLRLRGYEVT